MLWCIMIYGVIGFVHISIIPKKQPTSKFLLGGRLSFFFGLFSQPQQAQSIIEGNIEELLDSSDELIRELYYKMRSEGIAPKTIVDYTREPFVYPAGNVRVTLDYDIRSGIRCTDLLDPRCVTVPASGLIILEVKWDGFLPDIIRDAVSLVDRRSGAFSKYAACRRYG